MALSEDSSLAYQARGINACSRYYVGDWLPTYEEVEHLGIYGGNKEVRADLIMELIANAYGKMGIVIIHNDTVLADRISNFVNIYRELVEEYASQGIRVPRCIVDQQNMEYEPLYGLDENRAIEAIYPQISRDNPSYMQQHLCAEALRNYFRILQKNGDEIDLDGLLYLCNLSLDELSEYELGNFEPQEREQIISTLVQHNNIYLQVRADVNIFANHLDGRIWRKKEGDEEPSDISMIDAVRHQAFLSIRVPSNTYVLDYLASEFQAMMDHNMRFLLVIDSVMFGQSLLYDSVLRNPELPFSTVLSSESVHTLYGDDPNNIQSSLQRMDKLIVMKCKNVMQASAYSQLLGQYMRTFEAKNSGSHRGAFDLFAGHDSGTSTHEELYDRIRPEVFTALGDGAVLMDQRNDETILTEELRL